MKVFTLEEILRLSRAWDEKFSEGPGQTLSLLWEGMRAICKRKYKKDRTVDSLRVKERSIAHGTRIFLSFRERIAKEFPSGSNLDNM